jgi:hypothetical protein
MNWFLIAMMLTLMAPNLQAQEKQISFIGLTFHGIPVIEPKNSEGMKSKLDKSGVWAYNPQFNYTYYNGENLTNFSFLSDCYASPALNFSKGKRYQYNDKFYYGYVYGLYFRYNPDPKENREFNITENFQLIPNAAAILQYKVTDKITLRLTANYLINFFDIAYEF